MRLVIQRVASAEVTWSDPDPGGHLQRRSIGPGLAILVGSGPGDDEATAARLAAKVAALRVFEEIPGRMDRSLLDIAGEALVVSQFTLYADLTRGRRPSFVGAGDPAGAERVYLALAAGLKERGIGVATGRFGAHMTVSIVNDGPVTLVLSSDGWPTRV